MKFEFDAATFVMIQNLLYPVVSTFFGFDPAEWVGNQSELFLKIGDGFADISALFMVVGTALEDGKLSVEEIEEIISKSLTLPEALDEIISFFGDDEVLVTE